MSELGQELLQKKRAQVETLRARKKMEEERAEAEAKRKEELALKTKRQQLLQKLGYFVQPRKEYAPEGMGWREARDAGYDRQEPINGTTRFYRLVQNMPDITDEEYAELEALDKEAEEMSPKKEPVRRVEAPQEKSSQSNKKPESPKARFSARPVLTNYSSFACGFMKTLAYICWIAGFISAVAIWVILKTGFWAFLAEATGVFMAGSMLYCMAELFDHLAAIRTQLEGYDIKEQ